MRRPLSVICVVCCLAVLATTWTMGSSRDLGRPHRYLPSSLDGGLVQADRDIDGSRWCAWSYRNGAEFDIAISVTAGDGFWSEPLLLGLDDSRDQVNPALIADASGTLYLVYSERSTGRIMLSYLMPRMENWSTPTALTSTATPASAVALEIAGDRLVVAFNSHRTIKILDFPLLDGTVHGNIFNDGPDPVESSDPKDGTESNADDEEEEEDPGNHQPDVVDNSEGRPKRPD